MLFTTKATKSQVLKSLYYRMSSRINEYRIKCRPIRQQYFEIWNHVHAQTLQKRHFFWVWLFFTACRYLDSYLQLHNWSEYFHLTIFLLQFTQFMCNVWIWVWKSSFSEKATKIWKNIPLVLTLLSKNSCFVKTGGRFF